MSRYLLVVSVLVSVSLSGFAQTKEAAKVLNPNAVGVGRLVPNDKLKTLDGREVLLTDLVGENGLVIALSNTTCPLCKKYASTLAKLEQTLASKGFKLVLVNPTANEKPEDVKQFVAQHQLKSTYILDSDGTFAKQLGATTTTETFLLDKQRTIIYRGALDDQYGIGYSLDAPKNNYLLSAVTAHLAKIKVDPAATSSPGCELDLKSAKTTSTSVNYHNRISRIINTHCIECHRNGGVGPFKLETYEDVIAQAGMIRKVVEKGTMPPWFASPEPNGKLHHWANDRTVPKADKDDLFAWLKSDRPKGDAADAPLPKTFADGWNIGKPDAVYEFSKPVAVNANGTMPYQNVIVETKLTEDKWVKALEVRPSAPQVVHHVLVFAILPGEPENVEDERADFFAAYVPGQSNVSYPDGLAKRLPKGTKLRFQMHYTPNGTATQDSTKLGVIFAEKAPINEIHVLGIANTKINIKAGQERHPEYATFKVPQNATLLALMPHMHLRGAGFRYEITAPKGEAKTLLDIPHYDFNWQLYYRLAEPLQLTPGMELKATGWFDNSSKNPANPDPNSDVFWGPQTYEEMLIGYIEYYVPVGKHQPMVAPRQMIDANLLMLAVDLNKDGKISQEEFVTFMKTRPRLRDNPKLIDELFKQYDLNKDGYLSLDELKKLPNVKR
jgi:peroxiredoxin/mono/diheme cytochrome c family protein